MLYRLRKNVKRWASKVWDFLTRDNNIEWPS
jgi:hypothetical protein